MAFEPRFLDELRERSRLSDLVGRSVRLTRRGREHVGLCPFHQEKTPSFTVSDDKGFFHCFGCGAHGDVIGWLIQHEGLPFSEAVERLAGEAGLAVPRPSKDAQAKAKQAHDMVTMVGAASTWFQAELSKSGGAGARAYITKRGLPAESVSRFGLGYAPANRYALRSQLMGSGFAEPQLIQAGLLREGKDGGQSYDFFRDRLMFPITDGRDRPIAFGARALGDSEPKYLNSPDTPVFAKGRTLYNYARARKAALRAGSLIVAEGYMDVIAFDRAGIDSCVAPLGTAVTEDQLRLCWRLAAEPILCLDGDQAGQRAAFRAADRALPLLKPGQSLGFVFLPAGEDPDSLLHRHGKEALEAAVQKVVPLVELMWQREQSATPLDTPERRAGLKNRLMTLANQIQDQTVQSAYRDVFFEKLRALGGSQVRNAGRSPARSRAPHGQHTPPAKMGALAAPDTERQERLLVAAPLLRPAILPAIVESLSEIDFGNRDYLTIRDAILDIAVNNDQIEREALHSALAARDLETTVARVLRPSAWSRGLMEPFLQDEATDEEVERGWRETFDLLRTGAGRQEWQKGAPLENDE